MFQSHIKNKKNKVPNEKRLRLALGSRNAFLIQKMKDDWETLEKRAKQEKLVRQVKEGGIMIGKTILILLAIGGALTVATIAPNIFGAMGRLNNRKRFFHKNDFRVATKYLRNKKFIRIKKDDNAYRIQLTEQGFNTVISHSFNTLKIKKETPWDGIWHIVIFDIPDKRRWARDTLRMRLRMLGFHQVQKSVFIIPYPCDKELNFLTSLLNVEECVRLIKTREINNDSDLKEIFSL